MRWKFIKNMQTFCGKTTLKSESDMER